LGIVLAQPASCPPTRTHRNVCPQRRDSSKRPWPTALPCAQVLAPVEQKALVHRRMRPLLLQLCIYKNFNKKTGGLAQGGPTAGVPGARGAKTGMGALGGKSRARGQASAQPRSGRPAAVEPGHGATQACRGRARSRRHAGSKMSDKKGRVQWRSSQRARHQAPRQAPVRLTEGSGRPPGPPQAGVC
jgi:hypothetical protein